MGQWENDQPHGLGTFTFASGARYEGMWQQGKYEKAGTFTWPDGRQYKVDQILTLCMIKASESVSSKLLIMHALSCALCALLDNSAGFSSSDWMHFGLQHDFVSI
jgi:hypothetical protein